MQTPGKVEQPDPEAEQTETTPSDSSTVKNTDTETEPVEQVENPKPHKSKKTAK